MFTASCEIIYLATKVVLTTKQSQIKKDILLKEGFDFVYFTHIWKAKNGNIYHFCFEFGYRDLNDNGKYMLIMWQDYMN